MPTPAERQALVFIAAVAALGVGVRGCRALRPDSAPVQDRAALATQLAAVDSAITSGGARRASAARSRRAPESRAPVRASPRNESSAVQPAPGRSADPFLRDGEPRTVDVDIADAAALDRLPGIGPALAARIVADRDALGPFGSLPALERVKGIGPALAARLGPHVTFSLSPRPSETGGSLRERVARP